MPRYVFVVAGILLAAVCAAALCCDLEASVQDLPPDGKQERELLTLEAVQSESGPAIEGRIGDIVFQTSGFVILHKKRPHAHVLVAKGQVVYKRGDREARAKKMQVPIRQGMLSNGWPP